MTTSKGLAVLLALAVAGGCRRDSEPEKPAEAPPEAAAPAAAVSTPEQRMHDPVYVAKINDTLEERRGIMKDVAAAKARLDEAQAADPQDPAAVAEAEAALKKELDRLDRLQKRAQRLVAEQMATAYGPDGKPVEKELNEKKEN